MLTKKKRERTQINKIRNERGEIPDNTDIKNIIREYYEKLCTKKVDNLEETDKFLETYSLPKVIQKETDNLNRLITRSGIEFVILKTPCKQKSRNR